MTYPQELREQTYLLNEYYPFNMFHNVCPTGHKDRMVLGLHWHEHFEIILMIAGQAIFHIDSQPYEVLPNDILIVPAGGLHVGYSLNEETVKYISLVFNPAFLSVQLPNPIHSQYIAPFLEGRVHFPVKFAGIDEVNLPYRMVLQQAIQEFDAKELAYEIAVQSHLYMFFTLLSRKLLPDRQLEKASAVYSRNMERFKQLIFYVENHYSAKITIEAAAKIVCLNPYHFCKTFKKITGRTFIEFVNLRRMDEAQRLLEETDLTITEISERLGCGNPNYFTKLFKQFKGMAPSQLRKDYNYIP